MKTNLNDGREGNVILGPLGGAPPYVVPRGGGVARIHDRVFLRHARPVRFVRAGADDVGFFFLYRWLSNLGGTGMFLPDFSNDDFAVEIININVASQFLTHISTSFWFALVLMFPYLIFEVWRFVQPALFENERRSVGLAFLGGTVMFFSGLRRGVLFGLPFYVPFPDRVPAQRVDRQPDLAELLHGQFPDAGFRHGDRFRTAAAGMAALEAGAGEQDLFSAPTAAMRWSSCWYFRPSLPLRAIRSR